MREIPVISGDFFKILTIFRDFDFYAKGEKITKKLKAKIAPFWTKILDT